MSSYNIILSLPADILYDTPDKNCSFSIGGVQASSSCTYTTSASSFGESYISTITFANVTSQLASSGNVITITGLNPYYGIAYTSQDIITVTAQDSSGGTFGSGQISLIGKITTIYNKLVFKLCNGCAIYTSKDTEFTLLTTSTINLYSSNSNGQIDIIFPYNVFTDNMICTSKTSTGTTLSCSYTSSTYTFTLKSTSNIPASTEIQTTITSMKSRENAKPITGIKAIHYLKSLYSAKSDDLKIKIEPSPFADAYIERGTNLVTNQANNYKVTFKTNNTLLSDEWYFIEMFIPDSVMRYTTPDTYVQSLTLTHNGSAHIFSFSVTIEENRVHFLSERFNFNIQPSEPFYIDLTNVFANPSYVINYDTKPIPYAESSFIYVGKDLYYKEGKSTDVVVKQVIIPGSITINNVSRSSKSLASITSLSFSITLFTNPMKSTSDIVVAFPSGFFFKKESGNDIECINSVNSAILTCNASIDSTTKELKNITITKLCNQVSGCSGSTFSVIVNNIENPMKAYTASGQITFSTYDKHEIGDLKEVRYLMTDTGAYNLSSFPTLIMKQITRVFLYANNPIAKENTNITFVIYLDYTIAKNSTIVITFPTQVSIATKTRRNLAAIDCIGIFQTALSPSCSYDSSTSTITITGAFTNDITGGVASVQINNFKLSEKGLSESFGVNLLDNLGNTYGELKEAITITVTDDISGDCSSNCLTCGGTAEYCTSCDINSNTPLLFEGKCYDACPSNYIDFGNICAPCFSSNCSYCTIIFNSGCTGCKTGLYMSNGVCVTSCPTGTTATTDSQCKNSGVCNSPCSSCSYSKSFCITCMTNNAYLNTQGVCSTTCSTGFVANADKICKRCHPICESCTNTSSQGCIMCSSLNGLFSKNGKCLNDCGAHYYKNMTNRVCGACYDTCDKCDGDFENNCTSCAEYNGFVTFLHANQCLKLCPTSYYRNIFDNTCSVPEGIVFMKPTIVVTILLCIAAIVVLIINVARNKEPYSAHGIMYALIASVKFIDGLILTFYLSFFHLDLINMFLISFSNLVQIAMGTNFYMSVMININGRKYFDSEIHKFYAAYDKIIDRLFSLSLLGMGANAWRLMFSNLFAKPYFKLNVSRDIVFRKELFCHSLVEGVASVVSIVGCVYALIMQDSHSFYFAHAITFMLLNLALLGLLLVDFIVLKRLKRKGKVEVNFQRVEEVKADSAEPSSIRKKEEN